jgi:hypothetical protein
MYSQTYRIGKRNYIIASTDWKETVDLKIKKTFRANPAKRSRLQA